ncbi:homoserine kinase [Limosilactobacillus walteri]|uniref:Homoserine kinase n=1 Tax=Limosilactobacillus walteri TaxID=2268022 RepID=A0ABR8P5U3_9LACO|nr:homoserine kinase [Limosilactobacillus walteri]MBD5806079.1 homoserine kinase [Limosilactobacillus walteri]
MIIQVPASSANLGPGFDSIGIAVSLYLKLEVLGPSDNWQVDHQLGKLPHDETNMIVTTALSVASDLPPQHLRVVSDIPVTHGLGSSSSAIVAGVELANQLKELHLSKEEKVEIASQIEGHPDNVAPAILGGLVVGTHINGHFAALEAPLFPYDFAAYIPPYSLKTADARAALPYQLDYSQAVHASAIANTFVASLFTKNYDVAFKLMEADRFHEPYRKELVPELNQIRELGKKHGALATYLSGAGPTVMTVVDRDKYESFEQAVHAGGLDGKIVRLHPDVDGVKLI